VREQGNEITRKTTRRTFGCVFGLLRVYVHVTQVHECDRFEPNFFCYWQFIGEFIKMSFDICFAMYGADVDFSSIENWESHARIFLTNDCASSAAFDKVSCLLQYCTRSLVELYEFTIA
jgi:hypothetical protein